MVDLITILGPTASGKTNLACQLAQIIQGEIISADSRQIYTGMDIGTGKDIEEYSLSGNKIPYHLIDIREPGYKYNIWEYQSDFISAYQQIVNNQHIPILCGGSGLYIETALRGNSYTGIESNTDLRNELSSLSKSEITTRWESISDELKAKLNNNTLARTIRAIEIDEFIKNNSGWEAPIYPTINYTIFGIDIEREKRRSRITQRLSDRLNHGLIEEVVHLVEKGLAYQDLDYYGLEYRWVGQYLQSKITKKELFEGLNIAIHQFSKRQMTWFRRMEKQGYQIIWLDEAEPIDIKLNIMLTHLSQNNS